MLQRSPRTPQELPWGAFWTILAPLWSTFWVIYTPVGPLLANFPPCGIWWRLPLSQMACCDHFGVIGHSDCRPINMVNEFLQDPCSCN